MNDAHSEADRWLTSANEDREYARHAAEGGFHAPACFHAQQAAEKAVKAVHYARGARAVIGHNVRALIESLDPRVDPLDALLDDARELDLFYISSRYPNGLETGTPAEAFSKTQSDRALESAGRIVAAAGSAIRNGE